MSVGDMPSVVIITGRPNPEMYGMNLVLDHDPPAAPQSCRNEGAIGPAMTGRVRRQAARGTRSPHVLDGSTGGTLASRSGLTALPSRRSVRPCYP